ncbi:hypothetical protein P167DRAFT_293116 [Morchella conica CCBAS932]|uniref:Uncharacterized protein n=1 Tax=Morchella conica CCBAS932 TaxID=1392247 RepID=A0A3N4KJW3_9PEZI|nr:hypothetical protein P167DRAFT_293116 [Morchella conica CCBAS932]
MAISRSWVQLRGWEWCCACILVTGSGAASWAHSPVEVYGHSITFCKFIASLIILASRSEFSLPLSALPLPLNPICMVRAGCRIGPVYRNLFRPYSFIV